MDRPFREPTLVVEFVRALLVCAVVFGLPLSDAQTGAMLVLVSAGLALFNRSKVTPA